MDTEEAVEAIKVIRPEYTIPMHYGIVDGSYGGNHIHIELEVNINDFQLKAEKYSDVRILKHNETFDLEY
jgi:L-ascorbate metabolism protein UlaG (beta-lactamase superfamily)